MPIYKIIQSSGGYALVLREDQTVVIAVACGNSGLSLIVADSKIVRCTVESDDSYTIYNSYGQTIGVTDNVNIAIYMMNTEFLKEAPNV